MQYKIIDFTRNKEIYIHENAQQAPYYPLTLNCAKPFFNYFAEDSFELNRVVKSIFIFSGKYYPQGTSFADGYLYSKSLDELQILPKYEEFSGHILFEHRNNELHRIIIS